MRNLQHVFLLKNQENQPDRAFSSCLLHSATVNTGPPRRKDLLDTPGMDDRIDPILEFC